MTNKNKTTKTERVMVHTPGSLPHTIYYKTNFYQWLSNRQILLPPLKEEDSGRKEGDQRPEVLETDWWFHLSYNTY